jgi:hypothetical protein
MWQPATRSDWREIDKESTESHRRKTINRLNETKRTNANAHGVGDPREIERLDTFLTWKKWFLIRANFEIEREQSGYKMNRKAKRVT